MPIEIENRHGILTFDATPLASVDDVAACNGTAKLQLQDVTLLPLGMRLSGSFDDLDTWYHSATLNGSLAINLVDRLSALTPETAGFPVLGLS